MNSYLVFIKEAFKLLMSHIQEDTWKKIKDAFFKALVAFKDVLWKELKETVREQALLAIEAAQIYYQQEQVKVKKEELISQIVDKIKFPLLLKPFKGLMKSYISKKVEAIILDAFQKGHDFLA